MKVAIFSTLAFARRALEQTTAGRHTLRPREALITIADAVVASFNARAAPQPAPPQL